MARDDIPGIKFNRDLSTATQIIRGVQARLERLSLAFDDTGNERVSDELSNLSTSLETAIRSIHDSHSECLSSELREAQAGVAGVLSALINMPEDRAAKLNSLISG